jgi:hypothetical protein
MIVAGFGMLLVNYRGSIGAGQESVEFLPGRIGNSDVKDVHLAVVEALKQFPFLNPNKMVLFGGSHGGFLVTHLSGQFPVISLLSSQDSEYQKYKQYQNGDVRSVLFFPPRMLLIYVFILVSSTCNSHRTPPLDCRMCILFPVMRMFLILQDLFKAVVARNPVIDIPSMLVITDIPDW